MRFRSCLRTFVLCAAACVAMPAAAEAPPSTRVLRAARWLDVASGRMHAPATLVVAGGRIVALDPPALPAGAEVIDLGDATLLPGLMDMHTHLMDEPGGDWIRQRAYETPATWALRAARNARLALLNGFTTVRDLGSAGFVDVALMQAIDAGWIDGPRVVPVGHYITATGGHCDLTGFAPGVLERGAEAGVADGADAIARAVRYQVKHGARWIKMCATGGVLSFDATVGAQQYSEAELRAGVEEAARHGLRVAAHAHGTAGIHAAIGAGVASIEHGTMLDAEAIRLMKQRGIWLVPQAHFDEEGAEDAALDPVMRAKQDKLAPLARHSLEQAIAAGVKIAFSTDGPLPGNDPGREFAALVRRGMTPLQAIQAATIRAAELLEVDDRGRLAPGLQADVIAVPGDPTRRIAAMQEVAFVMKAGRVYKRP